MKHNILLLFAVLATAINVSAYDFEVDGIYYNTLSLEDLTCEVTYKDTGYNSYSGDIVIPSSVTYSGKAYSVTSIGQNAFYDCYKLTSVEIPSSVTSIGESAFWNCTGLASVEIPNSVTSILRSAFAGCHSLTSVVIPNSITSIGESVFWYCSRLTSVVIPNSVSSIKGGAFRGCSALKSLEIPNSVTTIEGEAFKDCTNLTSVTMGTGVISVGFDAFSYCSSLYKLILLPNTVPAGLDNALRGLSERVTYVANDNYSGGVYGTIKKYDYLSSYFDVDGIRYVPISPSERTCAAITCTYTKEINAIKMNNTVTYKGIEMKVIEEGNHLLRNNRYVESIKVSLPIDIPEYFAYGCSNTKSIVMNGVNSIGNDAFKYCEQLNSVVLNDEISSIGSSAFAYCKSMKSITIPSGVTVINAETFFSCDSLTSVVLPSSLKTIKSKAFANSGLTSIEIPSTITDIETGVFNGCKHLAKLTAKDGKEMLYLGYNSSGRGLFYDCPLKEVELGRSISYNTSKDYGYSPFYRNASLKSVKLTDIPTEVFTNEFYGCTALKNVSIGDGVDNIGDYAFSGCSALEIFTFGASMKTIGKEAFSDCTAMTELYAEPATPPTCDTQALDDINKWNCKLFVPESAQASYKGADQWKEFFFIEPYDYSVNGIISMEAKKAVLVSTQGGSIIVSGTERGEAIQLYSIDGRQLRAVSADDGQTVIPCNAGEGEVVIVKYGGKAVKVLM